ncbi:M48 family metallopeptidase [Haloechinothrix sp. LS1_15]|uniref:M48 family metallopeptidase n=1 Tax=Haloechinothrix sp. LS1_15 TaxID=2652248 RepID=UPI0029457AEE|nr:M48 family metallopeptidase [Haloechinothrix sp. LS1_15]MDV6012700.1 M48 family metallopeptidase [Haloechinothrix sp. LS1_15]
MSDEKPERSGRRVRFPGISPRAYEHPVDRGALGVLRSVPGFAEVIRTVSGFFVERGERMMALSSMIRVGPQQYPEIDRIRNECADTLDLERVPKVFVARSPDMAAYTLGLDEPFIVLTTGMLDKLDNAGLRFVVGHEMGHVLSGHAVYRTILHRLLSLQTAVGWMPVSALGLRAIIAALFEWYRKAELSCDRAGLLCGQDPEAALRVHVMLAGGLDPDEVDIPSFLEQASEYEGVEDIRDSIHKLRNVEHLSHPLAVVRAAQLQQWANSPEYRDILAGHYPRRDADEEQPEWTDDMAAAARSYKEAFTSSADPLSKVFTDVGNAVSGVAGKVWDRVGSRRRTGEEGDARDEGTGGGS